MKTVFEQIGAPDAFGQDPAELYRTPPISAGSPLDKGKSALETARDLLFGSPLKIGVEAAKKKAEETKSDFAAAIPRAAFFIMGGLLILVGVGAITFKGPAPVSVDVDKIVGRK